MVEFKMCGKLSIFYWLKCGILLNILGFRFIRFDENAIDSLIFTLKKGVETPIWQIIDARTPIQKSKLGELKQMKIKSAKIDIEGNTNIEMRWHSYTKNVRNAGNHKKHHLCTGVPE